MKSVGTPIAPIKADFPKFSDTPTIVGAYCPAGAWRPRNTQAS